MRRNVVSRAEAEPMFEWSHKVVEFEHFDKWSNLKE